MRDRFTFEENYLIAINELDDKLQLRVYKAIAHYALRDELPDLVGIAKAVFALIKPQIDANIRKSDNGKKGAGFGKLGGRPKKEETPRKPQDNPLGVLDEKPLNNPLGVLEKEIENEKEKQEKERTKEKEIKEKDKDKEKDLLPPLIPPMGDETKNSENRVLKIDLSGPNHTTKEKEKSFAKKEKEVRHFYGTYKNVLLSDSEYEKLMEYDNARAIIDFFSEMKEMKGYTYKRDYLAIKNWGIRAYDERNNKNTKATTRACTDAENKRRELENLNEIALAILSSPPA